MNILRIIKGTYNNLLSVNKELAEFRIKEGCNNCPLFVDGWCSSKRGGCGCLMSSKATLHDAKCPQGVWSNDQINQTRLKELQKEFK